MSPNSTCRCAAFEAFETPRDRYALCKLATPTQLLFPNTFLIWHPDYVSLIGMFSPAVDQVRWVHTMLIPPDRMGEDWAAHWEKTFALIEQTVFQQEDIATAVAIQRGLPSRANTGLHVGRLEHEVLRFHEGVDSAIAGILVPAGGEPTC
jgi:Rieske 2Fe-2S family protein